MIALAGLFRFGQAGRPMRAALSRLLSYLPPESAHDLAIRGLELSGAPKADPPDPRLAVQVAGLHLPSPIGLAAGFDKDARVWPRMLDAGFGFVEVGTLTPRPQPGNPRPRMFRLREDEAVINRLGFNNGGIAAALPRLRKHPLMGVNVGANKDSADRIADYAAAVAAVAPCASWITLNISSPNTPGLRDLQGDALADLLDAAAEARGADGPPLFLKVAPDLDEAQIRFIARTAAESRVAALIVSNTTVARPPGLRSRYRDEAGGLSGRPLMAPSTMVLRRFASELEGARPLIAAGGVATAEDVVNKFAAGASAVQLYTALAFRGVDLAARLNRDLAAVLDRHGVASMAEMTGARLPAG
jgi:dihydroorotate dehydrogenase